MSDAAVELAKGYIPVECECGSNMGVRVEVLEPKDGIPVLWWTLTYGN